MNKAVEITKRFQKIMYKNINRNRKIKIHVIKKYYNLVKRLEKKIDQRKYLAREKKRSNRRVMIILIYIIIIIIMDERLNANTGVPDGSPPQFLILH